MRRKEWNPPHRIQNVWYISFCWGLKLFNYKNLSIGLESFFSAGWIVLPGLFIFKYAGFWLFWSWLFFSVFFLCFAMNFIIENPWYEPGSLFEMAIGMQKKR